LKDRYHRSPRTIRKHFDQYDPVTGEFRIIKKPINLILDATFFKRGEGVLVARADGRNLFWMNIETEKVDNYQELLEVLLNAEYTFQSFVIDGCSGVRQLLERRFPFIPIQFCQFHQIKIITRYLTTRPKLEASKQLKKIVGELTTTSKSRFLRKLSKWYRRWDNFLRERTINPETDRKRYKHRRLRSAYFSLQRNLPYLFTYRKYLYLKIPNTTNSCEGSFSHWKPKVKIHRGISPKRKRKMIDYLLENS